MNPIERMFKEKAVSVLRRTKIGVVWYNKDSRFIPLKDVCKALNKFADKLEKEAKDAEVYSGKAYSRRNMLDYAMNEREGIVLREIASEIRRSCEK